MPSDAQPDILLIICPKHGVDAPPLGLGYLSRYLSSQGLRAEMLDLNIALYHKAGRKHRGKWSEAVFTDPEKSDVWNDEERCRRFLNETRGLLDEQIDRIVASPAKIIGFSVYSRNTLFSCAVADEIKRRAPEKTVVFGGPQCTPKAGRKILSAHADLLVVGEGEETLCELVRALKKNKSVADIPGVIATKGGRSGRFAPRTHIADLDRAPFPTYEGFALSKYTEGSRLWFMTSRGCSRACSFCDEKNYRRGYRTNSPEFAAGAIKYYAANLGVKTLLSGDTALNGNPRQLEALCDLLIDKGIHVEITGSALVRSGMEPELFKKMKRAGFSFLLFGLESGSDPVLKAMRKAFIVETAERVFHDCHHAGISVGINLIVGFPGETEDDFKETLSFLERNRGVIDKIGMLSTCHISPDSVLAKNPGEFGVEAGTPGGIHTSEWKSSRGDNTREIRENRMQRMLETLLSLGYLDRDLHARLAAKRSHSVFVMGEQFAHDRKRRARESTS